MFWTLEIPFKTGFTVLNDKLKRNILYRSFTNTWLPILKIGSFSFKDICLYFSSTRTDLNNSEQICIICQFWFKSEEYCFRTLHKNCIMRHFIICTLHQLLRWSNRGGNGQGIQYAWRDENCIKCFSLKHERRPTEDLQVTPYRDQLLALRNMIVNHQGPKRQWISRPAE
jgi:hypothetical protein